VIELSEHPRCSAMCGIATQGGELVALAFLGGWRRVEGHLQRHFPDDDWIDAAAPRQVTRGLDAYMAGELKALDRLRARAGGTEFQCRVWAAIRQVPPGRQRTYGELAGAAGVGHAVRAFGTACGANPVCLVILCHRIVRTSGDLAGYTGGLERKQWLLEHERRHRSPRAASVKR
jgi:methylated-DNA-[protein]-cysteine S-methyltransferase